MKSWVSPWLILAVWLGMVIFSNRRVLGVVSMIYAAVKVA